jgi:hypothetical protein
MRVWLPRALVVISMGAMVACASPSATTPTPHVQAAATERGDTPTSTSAPPTYHLYRPNAEEYLTAIPAVVTQMQEEDTDDTYWFRRLISEEFWSRYSDLEDIPFDVLYDADPFIDRTVRFEPGPDSDQAWHRRVLNAWLRENQPDLRTARLWQFRGYTLEIQQAVDFDGDGRDELPAILTFQPDPEKDYWDYVEYFVLQPDESQPEGYTRFGQTLFFLSRYCFYQQACGGDVENWGIEDLTGDGLPEWVFSANGCGYGICHADLLIVGWREGTFVNLTHDDPIFVDLPSGGGGPPSAPPGTWTLDNLDDDPATEIVQWESPGASCEFTVTRTFDWDEIAGVFTGSEATVEYADTAWCALRLAHLAMADLDFPSAIDHYEHMLTFDAGENVEAWQYVRLRLAAAYALDGQAGQAAALLDELVAEPSTSVLMEDMIDTAYSAFSIEHNPTRLCAALYSTIEGYDGWSSARVSNILHFGQINDYGVPLTYNGGNYSPSFTGCDVYGLWEQTVGALDSERPLDAQIAAAGWEIASQIRTDMNGDGIDELLVRPEVLPAKAAFRWSDGNMVHDAVVNGGWVGMGSSAQLATIPLPDDLGLGLVQITFNPSAPCYTDGGIAPGYVLVWRLAQDGLEKAGSSTICTAQTVEETFPVIGEMHILDSRPEPGNNWSGGPILMTWDSELLSYQRPSLEPTPTVSATTEDVLSCYGIYGFCGSSDEPLEALEMIDTVLSNPPPDATPQFVTGFHYYRALLLEDIGRDDEALQQYVDIYTAAPESAWGMLALLHLQENDG